MSLFYGLSKTYRRKGINYDAVDAAYVGYCYGESTSGQVRLRVFLTLVSIVLKTVVQRALYNLGLTGIPVFNVNNNCSTGSTALFGANVMVKGGLAECAMALGFEQMSAGSLKSTWTDRPSPSLIIGGASAEAEENLPSGDNFGPVAPRMFANAAQEYFDRYGGSVEHLAKIGTVLGYNSAPGDHFLRFTPSQQPPRTINTPSTVPMRSSTMDGAWSRYSTHRRLPSN